MSDFRPISARGVASPQFDVLHEEYPAWMHASIQTIIEKMTEGRSSILLAIETNLRFDNPLDWRTHNHARLDLFRRMRANGPLAIDVIDLLCQTFCDGETAGAIAVTLTAGGSAWQVMAADNGTYALERRAPGPTKDALLEVASLSERAGSHLNAAWRALMSNEPNPGVAYSQAIKAIEVVARPIVSPSDASATLGKMIAAIRAKPEKWQVVLEHSTSEEVAGMMAMVWKGQEDRHGTDDPNAPLEVDQEEADAAVHISIAVVRIFANGLITRVG